MPALVASALLAGCGGPLSSDDERFSLTAAEAGQRGLRAISFHFSYPNQLRLQRPQASGGPFVTLTAGRGSELRERVEIGLLDTNGLRRGSAAFLPILMERYRDTAKRRYRSLRTVQEGLTKIGELRAYQLFFTARPNLQGRLILVPRPGLTDGVTITMLATPAAGFERTTQIGVTGLGKKVLRSFRFGA